MIALSERQVLCLHSTLVKEFGGIDGVRDKGALASAVKSPFQTFGGEELFPNLFDKAARLAFGILQGHPFLDGNKRTAVHAMSVFLLANEIELSYDDDALVTLIYDIASGKAGERDLLEWILSHLAERQ